jgi:hypothetical protein
VDGEGSGHYDFTPFVGSGREFEVLLPKRRPAREIIVN